MRLSFSTRGWENGAWEDWTSAAADMHFSGIEVYNAHKNEALFDKGGPFHKYAVASTVRSLTENRMAIPCLDSSIDISGDVDAAVEAMKSLMHTAADLRVPYVGAYAAGENEDNVRAVIDSLLPVAAELRVAVLVKTTGIYSDTARLSQLMNHFACDEIGVIWDMHHTVREGKESAAQTIKNLGAYVRHVHLRDSDKNGEYCPIGEGSLPVADLMDALGSINYDGYISLVWKLEWSEEIDDREIIFPHFVTYMNQFESPRRKVSSSLYYSLRHNGRYVWQKDKLIESTFSQVLDRMVEEFPDQLAIKYTTLNYTRTYSEFRDDVDEFARALVALGVKAGTHVTMWATNLPQWYIAFWATTKIGAVLVTMNTAYKIHEAEYLLKQSDTHTLIYEESYRDSNYKEIVHELCPELDETKPGKPLHSHRLPFLRNVITVGFRQKGAITWDEALERGKSVPVEEVWRMASMVSPHDVCNMQ
ncbi:MAG: AMP-binding protein, partial [Clostridia bacterium]|nr:AMP-binding protein [Clostridia bacterium]